MKKDVEQRLHQKYRDEQDARLQERALKAEIAQMESLFAENTEVIREKDKPSLLELLQKYAEKLTDPRVVTRCGDRMDAQEGETR